MNKRSIYYLLNPGMRRFARRVYYYPGDVLDLLLGRRDRLTPPKGKIFIGSGDFVQQGNRLLKLLIEHTPLQPHHRVLDVGCGIGRLALPFTAYLNEKGSYEGFDIVKSGIKWCKKKISRAYPNFRFTHINLKNDLYNLNTHAEAKNFIFPYNDNEFDLVFLFSVFTHMLPADVNNYLNQISRVLKKGGTCLATFFILNAESEKSMDAGNGLKFNHDKGNYQLLDKKVREANVAYKEDYLKGLVVQNDLSLEHIHYGWWSGKHDEKDKHVDFQDILILKKL